MTLLQVTQARREPRARLLRFRLGDARGDERGAHDERDERDREGRGERPGQWSQKRGEGHEARVCEVEEGRENRQGREVHGRSVRRGDLGRLIGRERMPGRLALG
jgi:hypothetical protein